MNKPVPIGDYYSNSDGSFQLMTERGWIHVDDVKDLREELSKLNIFLDEELF